MLSKAVAAVLLSGACAFGAADPSPKEIVRRMCERDFENLPVRQQYTYKQRTVVKKLDKHGGVKETESETKEILWIDGTEYERLIAKDGRALTKAEERKEQEKFEREVDKRKRESDAQRRKRLAKKEKELQEEREFRLQIPDAYDFELLGEETVSGRPAYRIEAEPRRDVKLRGKAKSFLPKIRGEMWIDKETFELVRVRAETIDSISFAFGTVRLNKGMQFTVFQSMVNEEVWFPTDVKVEATAKALLFFGVSVNVEQKLFDFKKYSVESTVTIAEER